MCGEKKLKKNQIIQAVEQLKVKAPLAHAIIEPAASSFLTRYASLKLEWSKELIGLVSFVLSALH